MLLWSLGCIYLFKLVFLFFFFPDVYPGVESLSHMSTSSSSSGFHCVNTPMPSSWQPHLSLLCVCNQHATPPQLPTNPSESWHFTINKDILLYDHSTVLTLRKFSIDTTLLDVMSSIFKYPVVPIVSFMACGGRSKAVQDLKKYIFIYLDAPDLSMAYDLSVTACRNQFPDQVWNLGPLHWECRVLATRPPEKSPGYYLESCVAFTQISLVSFDVNQVNLQSFAFLSLQRHFWRAQASYCMECSSLWTYLFPHVSLSIIYVWKSIYVCFWDPAYKQICWKC